MHISKTQIDTEHMFKQKTHLGYWSGYLLLTEETELLSGRKIKYL